MNVYYIGIDIGTSSVKVLAKKVGGERIKVKAGYSANMPESWFNAIKIALSDLWTIISPKDVIAVGLSSQVGTFVTDEGYVVPWNSSAGKEELDFIKNEIRQEEFIREISMPHPDIISFPLPRLLYIKSNRPNVKRVDMPKEIIVEKLTGNRITDCFSQRGIYDFRNKRYAEKLLCKFGIDVFLAEVKYPTGIAGHITENAAKTFGFRAGTPVVAGCNDFFAGLLGLGVYDTGDVFDLSGTSEHIGFSVFYAVHNGF